MIRQQLLRFFRFGLVGISVLLAHLGSLLLSVHVFHLSYVWANGVAITIASLFSYIGHRSFTFQSRTRHGQSIPRFLIQLTYTYALSFWIMDWMISRNGSYLYAAAIIWVMLPIVNFLVMQFWVFLPKALQR